MPIKNSRDINGRYYQYGTRGKKYYYITGNKKSREIAKKKAIKQAVAVGYKTKKFVI